MWVCIVAGVPAAGKSTLCRELLSKLPRDSTVHVDLDLHLGKIGPQESYKHCRSLSITTCLNECKIQEKNVLFDDCMWLRSMRKPVRDWCRENGYRFGVVWVRVESLEEATKRDKKRARSVGEETLKRVWETSQLPREAVVVESTKVEKVLEYISGLRVPEKRTIQEMEQVEARKHRLNLILCKLAGELVKSGVDPQVVCKAKKHLLQTTMEYTDEWLRVQFIKQCQLEAGQY